MGDKHSKHKGAKMPTDEPKPTTTKRTTGNSSTESHKPKSSDDVKSSSRRSKDDQAAERKDKKKSRKDKKAAKAERRAAKEKIIEQVEELERDGVGEGELVFNSTPDQKVNREDFELMTLIGKGSFGKVMQVQKKDDKKIFAMKVLRKEAIIARKQVTHTKAEKSILQKIQHPFIVKLHYAFQTKDKLYMILDYVNGGELFFHLKREGRFSEERVRFYAAEIISALAHLHSLDIVYRDLKPENILLNREGHVVITDFGLSKEIDQDEGTHTFCGTPEYLAPEVLKGQGHGMGVDWWSLGTLLYEMLTGLPPFFSQNINIMYQKILNGELKFPSHISPEAQSLLTGFLTRDPDERIGSRDTGGEIKIKQHAWFEGLDWDKLDRYEIPPPWVPDVTDELDVGQIDSTFTQEAPTDSPEEDSPVAGGGDLNFQGFTYQGEGVLAGAK